MTGDLRQMGVGELYDRQAARTPDRLALVHDQRHVTYAELAGRAHDRARRLLAKGARPGERVVVSVDPSIDAFVAMLAVLHARCVLVPIDSGMPRKRQQATMDDAMPVAVIAPSGSHGQDGSEWTIEMLDVAHGTARRHGDDARVLTSERDMEQDCALILYTSGVTGRPKGVRVTARALVNHFRWMFENHPLREPDVALVYRSASVIASLWDHFGPLLQGVPVVVASNGRRRADGALIVGAAARWGVSHVSGAPAFWQAIVDQPKAHLSAWRTMRLAITSGERLHVDLLRAWMRVFPEARLLNIYGLTECCRPAACEVTAWKADASYAPIGRPTAGATILLLDQQMVSVPPGTTGEICVAGPCVSAGYVHLPELTAERFASPGHRPDGEVLFRTGDLGRWRPDGLLELVGRADEQVQVRGHRVELGDVEAALLQHPDVGQAAVVVRADAVDKGQLVAHLVVRTGQMPSWDDLREHMKQRLPDYMIPSFFVQAVALPRTASGKIDRKALSERILDGWRHDEPAPAPATEEVLAEIMAEVLGVSEVHLDDNFLRLGGHSLIAMQLVARVFDQFSVELDLAMLFDSDLTVRDLSVRILELCHAAQGEQA